MPWGCDLSDSAAVEPNSFYGRLRTLYRDKVLKTQLDQLKKQGSYRVFDHQWQDAFNVRPLKGAMTRVSAGDCACND